MAEFVTRLGYGLLYPPIAVIPLLLVVFAFAAFRYRWAKALLDVWFIFLFAFIVYHCVVYGKLPLSPGYFRP